MAAPRAASHPRRVTDVASILEGWSDFGRELNRCRRHGRPFALIFVPIQLDRAGRQRRLVRRRTPGRPTSHQPATLLVRTTDMVLVQGGAIYLLLPETDREQATRCLERLRTADPEWPEDDVHLVVFPDDGYTLGKLALRLERRRSVFKDVPRLHADSIEPVNGRESTSRGVGDAGCEVIA